MADLLTLDTLARWTQNDLADVQADEFAADLISKVSALICFVGGHDGSKKDSAGNTIPEWTLEAGSAQAPVDVQMVALQVIKRSYENPDQVTAEGATGPIGGDTHVDTYALFADFTDSERAVIAKYNPDGDPTAEEGAGVIFTMTTTRGPETTLKPVTLYVPDDQQIGMTPDKNAYPSWDLPLFNPGDPGDENNYDDTEG